MRRDFFQRADFLNTLAKLWAPWYNEYFAPNPPYCATTLLQGAPFSGDILYQVSIFKKAKSEET